MTVERRRGLRLHDLDRHRNWYMKSFLHVESLKLNDQFLPPVAASAALHLGHLLIDKLTIVIVTSLNENERARVTLTPLCWDLLFDRLNSLFK